jgi:hypothetical protein
LPAFANRYFQDWEAMQDTASQSIILDIRPAELAG